MLDPLPIPPWLRDSAEPLTNLLHLHTLTLHVHEVLLSFAVYSFINDVLAPHISAWLIPTRYAKFPRRTRLQWNIHVTSFVNATFLSFAAPYVLSADKDLLINTWEERLWGYTGACGMVQAFGVGYFLWDLKVCILNFELLGVIDLVHAMVAVIITTLGYRPFGLYYGIQYAFIELSTPFVNIHWFLNKLDRAGSNLQIINGVVLIITFACCRLIFGCYLAVVFFRDVWTALHSPHMSWTEYNYSPTEKPLVLQHQAVWWVAAIFMITHAIVMSLSAFWFIKMIMTVRKHINSSSGRSKVRHV